jgi:hypothetical protein
MLRRGVYVWCENGEAIGWRRYNGHYSSIAVGVEEHFSLGEFLRRTSLSPVSPKSVCQLSSDSFHKRASSGMFCKMLLTNLQPSIHESYGYGEGVPFRPLQLRFVSNGLTPVPFLNDYQFNLCLLALRSGKWQR